MSALNKYFLDMAKPSGAMKKSTQETARLKQKNKRKRRRQRAEVADAQMMGPLK